MEEQPISQLIHEQQQVTSPVPDGSMHKEGQRTRDHATGAMEQAVGSGEGTLQLTQDDAAPLPLRAADVS